MIQVAIQEADSIDHQVRNHDPTALNIMKNNYRIRKKFIGEE